MFIGNTFSLVKISKVMENNKEEKNHSLLLYIMVFSLSHILPFFSNLILKTFFVSLNLLCYMTWLLGSSQMNKCTKVFMPCLLLYI